MIKEKSNVVGIEDLRAQLSHLKGRATIALFENGKKVHEQTDDNMLTDWVANLLSLPPSVWAYNANSLCSYLDYMMPIARKLFGGVCLWDSTLDEDADIVYPPAGVGCVGYAGSSYAGTNPYRGSHNDTESGAITGGYRHVWDFTTSQAVGTIRALSLTSRDGGNRGWKGSSADVDTNGLFLALMNGKGLYADISSESDSAKGYPILVDYLEDSTEVYSLYGGKLSKHVLPSVEKIKLVDGRAGASAITSTEIATVRDLPWMYWHDGKFHQVWTSSTSAIRHMTWDKTGAAVADTTVTITGVTAIYSTINSSYAYYLDGFYYVKTADGWAKLNSSGVYQAMLTTDSSAGHYPDCVNGLIYDSKSGKAFLSTALTSARLDNIGFYAVDENGFYWWGCDDDAGYYQWYSGGCTCAQHPWLSVGGFQYISNGNGYPFDIYPISVGIASINNLATPITKSAAQTMKITYEITQEVT